MTRMGSRARLAAKGLRTLAHIDELTAIDAVSPALPC